MLSFSAAAASYIVILIVLQWPPKGPNSPYDPLNFDPEVCREYGGYMDESGRFGGGGRFGDR